MRKAEKYAKGEGHIKEHHTTKTTRNLRDVEKIGPVIAMVEKMNRRQKKGVIFGRV
jgi:hypothetical protein